MNNNYKIWCTYHKPEIPQEYNLSENIQEYSLKIYSISCKETINDFDKLHTWLKFNTKSGIIRYIIKSDIEFTKEQLENIKDIYYVYICHNEEEFINAKNNLDYCENIELKLNERIHCDNSIEFYNGNYYIETY